MTALKFGHLALCLAAIAVPPTAVAAESASSVINIAARVPTICRVGFEGTATYENATVLNLGTMNEFCNSAHGYRVVLLHPDGLAGATAFVNGRAVSLSAGNETVLIDSDVPAWTQSGLKIDLRDHVDDITSLSFRTEAKDAIY